jgi:2',3'-cyclic-nucleotide 2'-phosphodiesterase (5'-nucleotidase family)
MRDKADLDGSDILIVDTGDRVEGNAIYDSSKPRGKFTYEIAKEQHIDLISSGNHELYKADTAEGEYFHTVPDFKGNYLASNLDIYNPKTGKLEPLAPRYKKFTTKNQGIRILAFGFIFDFTGNANNTVVQRVEDTVKEEWFAEAIRDKDLDLIIVFGHVDIRSAEYALLFKTIRSVQWDTPIQFFGGHSHIRVSVPIVFDMPEHYLSWFKGTNELTHSRTSRSSTAIRWLLKVDATWKHWVSCRSTD